MKDHSTLPQESQTVAASTASAVNEPSAIAATAQGDVITDADKLAVATFPPLSRRMIAYFIDVAIVTITASAALLAVLYLTSGSSFAGALASLGQGVGAFAITLILTNFVYHVAMERQARYKGTVGKLCMGLEVVDHEGLSLTTGRAMLRALARFAPVISGGLLYLVAVRGGQFRSLHDRLADTYVVVRNKGQVDLQQAFQGRRKMGILDWLCVAGALGLFYAYALPLGSRLIVRLLGAVI